MKRLRYGIVVLAAITLGACTTLEEFYIAPEKRIDHLIAKQEYARALAVLESLPPDGPEAAGRQQKRQQIEALIADYERAVLEDVRRKQERDELAKAYKMLDLALRKVPGSARLQQIRAALREQQAERMREIEERLLIADAELLLQKESLWEERAQVKIDGSDGTETRTQTEQVRAKLRTCRERLMECGLRALDSGKLERADKCLNLAQQIEHKGDVAQALARLNEKKTSLTRQVRVKKQRTQEVQRRKESEQLLTRLHEAIAAADLPGAQLALSKLDSLGIQSRELADLQQALNNAISAKVEELLEQGNALYRDEKVQEAKAAWEAALTLDPANERARMSIERADTVLKKLQELQQQQQPASRSHNQNSVQTDPRTAGRR